MAVPDPITTAYDPERFRADGHRLIDTIADQLARWQAREGHILPWVDPTTSRTQWAVRDDGGADLVAELGQIMRASTALIHPRCMAHQVAPVLPGAALAELVAAVLNNGM